MTKRHRDAIAIVEGACNPSAMAISLISACKECIETNVTQRDDAAVKLIASQIAYVCGIWNGVDNWNTGYFLDCIAECEKIVKEEKEAKEVAIS